MEQIDHLKSALLILEYLDLPRAQRNERSAFWLLALLNLTPEKTWTLAESPLMGITPMMDFCREHYGKNYAPNTRETFRRQTIHQFRDAGIVTYNPDQPDRPVNSPAAVYQISPEALTLLKTYGTPLWDSALAHYHSIQESLVAKYAKARNQKLVPIQIADGMNIEISPGEHSDLIKAIVDDFAPRYAPDGVLIYIGDTGKKWGYFDKQRLEGLGVVVDSHGKMPDVVIYYSEKNWLLLIESVTSHGPVDGKRHNELANLFSGCSAGLVYVTAFPSRALMQSYLPEIAWETEVWVADAPSHLIHFNGERFLGPYN